MKRNEMNVYKDDINLREKKFSKKIINFFVIILVLGLLSYCGYYLYQNKDEFNLDLSFLWSINDSKVIDGSNTNNNQSNNKPNNSKNNELFVPELYEKTYGNDREYHLNFHNLKADELGYTLDVTFEAIYNSYTLNCEKVLIDGFDTTTNISFTIPINNIITKNIRINKTELDALNINNFNNLRFFCYVDILDQQSQINSFIVNTTQLIEAQNERKGLIEIDTKNKTTVSYYQTVEDNEAIYIYFDVKNNNNDKKQKILIKKLVINDEIYEYDKLNEEIYMNTEKIINITIPKSSVRKVNSFTVSFFIIVEEDGFQKEIYITNEYHRNFQ